MKLRSVPVLVLCAALVSSARAADDETAPKTSMKEVLKARMAEEAKKKPASPPAGAGPANPVAGGGPVAGPSTPATTAPVPTTAPAPTSAPAIKPEHPASGTAPATPPPKDAKKKTGDSAAVLPKVEVKKGRITELDQQLAKQEQDLARERKNLKASEVDVALNDAKVAKPLSIFGGESSQFRQRVASERVELMEAEKDIMEAIARAKTKEEKEELQKQLDQIKAFRRDLEKSLR